MQVEGVRPWVLLRTEDASQTVPIGTTYTTSFTLPTGFLSFWGDNPLILTDSSNQPTYLAEVPYADRFLYQTTLGLFAVDYTNSLIYLMGSMPTAFTLHTNYIKVSTLVSAASTNTWVFPVRFHKILGFYIAVMWKLGVDYDIINNAQGNEQAKAAALILDVMTRWDSNLVNSMQKGKQFVGPSFNSGLISPNGSSGGFVA